MAALPPFFAHLATDLVIRSSPEVGTNALRTVSSSDKLTFASAVTLFVIGIFICDILITLDDEYRVIRRMSSLNLPMVAHYFSRVVSAFYVLLVFVYRVVPVNNCDLLRRIMEVGLMLSITSTSFSFLLRVRAISENSLPITILFVTIWLGIVAASILSISIPHSHTIDRNGICVIVPKNGVGISLWPAIVMAGFDGLVFVVISGRLLSGMTVRSLDDIPGSWARRVTIWVRGDHLPRLSRFLLRRGYWYYLSAVGLDIVELCVAFTRPSFASSAELIMCFVFLDVVLKNIFSCSLYRRTILDALRHSNSGVGITLQKQTTLQFRHGTEGNSLSGVDTTHLGNQDMQSNTVNVNKAGLAT